MQPGAVVQQAGSRFPAGAAIKNPAHKGRVEKYAAVTG
jgi:hypothetical protein